MSQRTFITLRTPDSPISVDIEVPEDQPISMILPDILKVLGWPQPSRDQKIAYRLTAEDGRLVNSQDTVEGLGINNFETIWISAVQPEQTGELVLPGALPAEENQASKASPEERRTAPASPITVEVNLIDQPCLVSEGGMIFILGKPPITIGRKSGNYQPSIDLTELDVDMRSSRQHAVIQESSSHYSLHAHKTTNGTFVNGVELTADQSQEIKDRDTIQFGFRGVKLVFLLPG